MTDEAQSTLQADVEWWVGYLRSQKEFVSPRHEVRTRGAAIILGCSQGHLRNQRSRLDGPPSKGSGGRVLYLIVELLRYDRLRKAA